MRFEQKGTPVQVRRTIRVTTAVTILIIQVALIIAYFYFDRNGVVSVVLRSWGVWGILLSIVLMAGFSVFPVPSEFLLILNMKVYGVVFGVLFAWVGAMIGTLMIFFIVRYLASPIVYDLISSKHLEKVETWVKKKGVIGLLLARLLPIPAPLVNYTAGLLKSVDLWSYMWTMGVSIWPYYIGAAFLFIGVPDRIVYWIVLGLVLLVLIWIVGFILNRKIEKSKM